MGVVSKTITLTEQQETWIADQVAADSEVIRELIRRERAHNLAIKRQALVRGERSDESTPVDIEAFLERVTSAKD